MNRLKKIKKKILNILYKKKRENKKKFPNPKKERIENIVSINLLSYPY